ncbi:uncharacterized protein APUU_40964A [Aspergillus puulaauensis]|uniref:Uncharacterized protein n=1 Tax=Aspergillus puulaauensis TaxID=1220207 RepID=A0A7R8APG0_9EURO|nr:uncharacterized protein APUU_40964A [Aspergillus puulaauensis]BCS24520.1 hypothetical protein APUU_40964A [Aspergillus puulaauensis]
MFGIHTKSIYTKLQLQSDHHSHSLTASELSRELPELTIPLTNFDCACTDFTPTSRNTLPKGNLFLDVSGCIMDHKFA